jgi:hypothetical protein
MNKVYVFVRGGCVQEIRTKEPIQAEIVIFDVDNKSEKGQYGDEIDAEWDEIKKKTNVIY